MDLIDLEAQKLPTPIISCRVCMHGTVFKLNTWFQCCDCGNVSTEWGGDYQLGEPSQEWKDLCRKSQSIIDQKR